MAITRDPGHAIVEIDECYKKLQTLIATYSNKYPNFKQLQALSNILNEEEIAQRQTNNEKEKSNIRLTQIQQFALSLKEKMANIKHNHHWFLRFAYNAFSIITILPAAIRAGISYAKYDTCRFWQPAGKIVLNKLHAETQKLVSDSKLDENARTSITERLMVSNKI